MTAPCAGVESGDGSRMAIIFLKAHRMNRSSCRKSIAKHRTSVLRGLQRFVVAILTLSLPSVASAGSSPFKFGYIPLDQAVFDQQPKVPRYRAFLPVSVDLSKHFPTPGMQSAESCTGWAVGYAARSYYAATLEKRNVRRSQNVPSPSYIYNAIRDPKNCASGSLILDALSLLAKGSLSAQEFPSDLECRIPTKAERGRALDFRIKRWLAVDPRQIDDVKGQLALGNPVIFGIYVGESFERLKGKNVYRGEDKTTLAHAMTVVGYDDQRQALKIINSWGTLWGDNGFGWIDYETFKKSSGEAYIIEVEDKLATQSEEVDVVVPKPTVKPQPSSPQEVVIAVPEIDNEQETAPDKIGDKDVIIPPVIERPVTDADCSFVYSDNRSERTRLTGFVGTERELQRLRQQWSGYAEDFDVEVRPWPQCEVLLTLASVLGEKDAPLLATKGGKKSFLEGEEMVFELTTPTSPSYVYVSYVQADGSVVTLMQPEQNLTPAKRVEKVIFGDGRGGSRRFTAAPPFGTEMVLAVASASPLFEGSLPYVQSEREFLSALRRAILFKSDQSKGDRRVSAAFLGIETEAKK